MDKKKKILIGVIALVVIIVIVGIVAIIKSNSDSSDEKESSTSSSAAKSAVESYISALNDLDVSKLMKYTDFKAILAFYDCEAEVDDDGFYDEFKGAYEEVDDTEVEDTEEYMEELYDYLVDSIEGYKIEIKEFEDIEKIGSGLYKVEANIQTTDEDGEKDEETTTFYTYKGKVITME